MALVNDVAEARYHFRDIDGKERTMSLYAAVPAAPAGYANLITFFDYIGDAMAVGNALTLNNQYAYDLIIHKREDAFTVSTYEVERMLQMDILANDGGDPTFRFSLPTYNNLASYEGDEGIVDPEHALVAPLLTMLIDGDGTVAPVDMRGMDLIASSGSAGSYQVEKCIKIHNRSHLNSVSAAG